MCGVFGLLLLPNSTYVPHLTVHTSLIVSPSHFPLYFYRSLTLSYALQPHQLHLCVCATINAPITLFLLQVSEKSMHFLTPSPTPTLCPSQAGLIQTFKDKSEYPFSPFKC